MPNGNVMSVPIRNFYPGSGSATVGQAATAPSVYTGMVGNGNNTSRNSTAAPSGQDVDPHTQRALDIAPLGKPLPYWLMLVGLLLALGWAAQKFGSNADQFKSIKLSAYNVLIISIASIIGTSFLKTLFVKYPVPGLTSVVLAG